jgi:hypothetical protein
MSDTGSTTSPTTGSTTGTRRTTRPAPVPEPTGWVGWLAFAAIMLLMVGTFQIINGLVAIFDPGYYVVTDSGLALTVDYTVWGWVHLALGALAVGCGLGVLAGQTWARVVGMVFAGVSLLANLGFMAAYPIWSITVVALDVVVIYALAVHGREMQL